MNPEDMTRSELLAVAALVRPDAPIALRLLATGIRENVTQKNGKLRRAREAAALLLDRLVEQ